MSELTGSRPFPCPDRDTLQAWLVGRLNSEQLVAISDHIDVCDTCGNALDAIDDSCDSLTAELRQPADDEPFDAEDECRIVAAVSGAWGFESGEVIELPDVRPDLPEGLTKIRQWDLHEIIGRGSMGLVCRATDESGHVVAIKVIPDVTRESRLKRFQREVKIACSLEHPGIVRSVAGDLEQSVAWLAMEWLDGVDLHVVLRELKQLSISNAAEIGRQVAAALAYSNDRGIVHRDLKPSNLMLRADGRICVLDFGLARVNLEDEERGLTSSAQLLGTADYIAPEQTMNPRDVDIRADLYSLGCLLFHCVLGDAPFGSERSLLKKLKAHRTQGVPPLEVHLPEAPDGFTRVIRDLCLRDRSDRPDNPADIAARLEPWADGADLLDVFQRVQQ